MDGEESALDELLVPRDEGFSSIWPIDKRCAGERVCSVGLLPRERRFDGDIWAWEVWWANGLLSWAAGAAVLANTSSLSTLRFGASCSGCSVGLMRGASTGGPAGCADSRCACQDDKLLRIGVWYRLVNGL